MQPPQDRLAPAPARAPAAKADFGSIYDQPTPVAYLRAMAALDYRPPAHGRPIFSRCLDELERLRGCSRPTVLDLCCSYGINAALLRYELELETLYRRAAAEPEAGSAERDRAFFARLPRRPREVRTLGLDAAARAVGYGVDTGLLDRGLVANLETSGAPSLPDLADERVALVTVTGGVGYIGAPTFRGVLSRLAGPCPWVACLVLRFIPFEACGEALEAAGLTVERWTGGTFTQRRFASGEERDFALRELERLGVDPTGREAEGWLHTDLYLARPPEEAAAAPLSGLLE
jgi:hypothetical protein